MRLDHLHRDHDGTWRVGVTLSRRNLVSLLAKLDGHPPASHLTLIKDEDLGYLTLKAEPDEAHYGTRGYGPGPMHPETEANL